MGGGRDALLLSKDYYKAKSSLVPCCLCKALEYKKYFMKILYFSFVELDIPNACQTHTLGVLTGFERNSCKIDAIVPRPKKIRPIINGARFYYLWPWRFSTLGRLWIKVLGGIFFFMLCLWNKYDAIYVRELEVNPFPRWCSIVFRIPLYIEVNGILLQDLKYSDANQKRILRAERYQTADFSHATGLIVPSYSRLRWIIDYYDLKPSKVHMILNGADITPNPKIKRSKVLKDLGLPEDGFHLGFLGNIWVSYDLKSILKAMELCQKEMPNLYLIIIGNGPEIDNFRIKAQKKQLASKLVFLGYIQPELLFEIMGAVDVGLMNLTKKGLQDLGPVTTRFATYAAFQLPVIANNLFLEHYPDELNAGLSVVPCEDPQALAQMIIWLYKHPEDRKAKSEILHNFVVKNLTWDSVAKEIMDVICHDKQI